MRTTSHTPTTTTGSNAYSLLETQPHPKRFALPQTEDDILRGRDAGIPETTKKDTRYCVSAWSKEREQTTHTHIPSLSTMTVAQLSHWMTRFILEARKKNGDPYPPNSLHHIVTGLMRQLRWSGRVIDFFQGLQLHRVPCFPRLGNEETPEYWARVREAASGGDHGGG